MASVDLLFQDPPKGPGSPVHLVFGARSAPPAIDPVTLSAAGQLTGIAQSLHALTGVRVQAVGRVTGIGQPLHAIAGVRVQAVGRITGIGQPLHAIAGVRVQAVGRITGIAQHLPAQALGIPAVQVQAVGAITGIAQHLLVIAGLQMQAVGRITGLYQPLAAQFDINLKRATVSATRAVWQDSARAQAATAVAYRQALPLPTRVSERWQNAQPLFTHNRVWQQDAQRLRNAIASTFEQAQRTPTAPLAVRLQDAQRLRHAIANAFEQAVRTPTAPLAVLFERAYTDRHAQVASVFQVAQRLSRPTASRMGIAVQIALGFDGAYQQAWSPRIGITVVVPPVPPKPPSCYDPALPAHLVFDAPRFGPGPVHLVFACKPGTGPVDPEQPGATLFILPARFYMSVHTLSALRLPDLSPVPLFDASLSSDAGSFAWTFSASGPASLFEQLAPTAGLPTQIRITLDGIDFVFVVDSIQREEAFGKAGVRIAGRSATALLARPYAREIARLNTDQRTAQQLAADALEFSGAGLDWGLTDWLVPPGAWSHTGTPLAAVQAIVEAAGGYLQSHRSAATLLARHPYPTLPGGVPGGPWNWGGAFAADVELAPDAIITAGIERRDGPDVNAVYVSGTTQGVLALVQRTGSGANRLAPLLTDPLITAPEVAQQRGLSVLGAAGPKHLVSLSLPVLTGAGQPGVLDVGQLVQVNAAVPWRARVRSVSVSAKLPSVRQTVALERHLETA